MLPVVVSRRRSARGIKLGADAVKGVVSLSLPARGGIAEALALLHSHQVWLAERVAAWPQPTPFVAGGRIPFDGGTLRLDWHTDFPRAPRQIGDSLQLGGPPSQLPARVRRWLHAAALADMTAATHRLAAEVDRPVAHVRIGDPRGRWGSCATGTPGRGGRIAYSWRLILAPAFVRANVVAHEVAHLVHADHGPGFHACLAGLDPNAAASRRWLRAHGAALHWVGRETPPAAPQR